MCVCVCIWENWKLIKHALILSRNNLSSQLLTHLSVFKPSSGRMNF